MKTFAITKPLAARPVKKIRKENYRVTTLEIDAELEAMPGQFLMVWMPGVGERPMSIGNDRPLMISVADVGKVSHAICSLKEGDLISYRGPLGKPFTIQKSAKRILVIGGGYGVVPLYFLSKFAKNKKIEASAVIGARTANDIIYEKKLASVCKEVFVTTDDGSRGKKGNVMMEAEALIKNKNKKFDAVYACGPERMMLAVAQLCKKERKKCQVSMERYMKCGVGVCGSCDCGGKMVCRDGPVFEENEMLNNPDFGKSRRDASGRAAGI